MRHFHRSGIVSRSAGQSASTEKTLLSASDFQYLGEFYTPTTEAGGEFHFSRGFFSIQRVGGTQRFWMQGNQSFARIYVFDRVGFGQTASIRNTFEATWTDKVLIKNEADTSRMSSMAWIDDQLWLVYTTAYEGTSHNPSYIAIDPNEANNTLTSYGPWGVTNVHSGYTAGSLSKIPQWFQTQYNTGSVMCISRQTVQRGNSSHGVSCYAMNLPAKTAPADTLSGPPYTITAQKMAEGTITNPMARPTQPEVIICRNDSYDPVADRMGAFWNGSEEDIPAAVSLDWVDSGVWIDGESKHGIVAVGQWVDKIAGDTYPVDTMPHAWYGPGVCIHGHDGTPHGYEGNGPSTAGLASYMWITDPVVLGEGITGQRPLHECVPTHSIKMSQIEDYPHGDRRVHNYEFGGVAYDPVDKLMFVSVKLRHQNQWGHLVPKIMVFSVNA